MGAAGESVYGVVEGSYNDPAVERDGGFHYEHAVRDGVRQSTARQFLLPRLRPGEDKLEILHVVLGANVEEILLEDGRGRGEEARRRCRGVPRSVRRSVPLPPRTRDAYPRAALPPLPARQGAPDPRAADARIRNEGDRAQRRGLRESAPPPPFRDRTQRGAGGGRRPDGGGRQEPAGPPHRTAQIPPRGGGRGVVPQVGGEALPPPAVDRPLTFHLKADLSRPTELIRHVHTITSSPLPRPPLPDPPPLPHTLRRVRRGLRPVLAGVHQADRVHGVPPGRHVSDGA